MNSKHLDPQSARKTKKRKVRACLGQLFSSLNFYHSSLITHFFTLIWQHHFYFHHSIFSHYSWVPHLSTGTVFFFFLFFSVPNSPTLIFKKKKNRTANANPERKKKVKRWSKVTAVGPLCVFNYSITIELWVMEIELWKPSYRLSNGYWVMGLTIFELWVIEIENWVTKIGNPNML